jgi:catabolite regulation protein CreA
MLSFTICVNNANNTVSCKQNKKIQISENKEKNKINKIKKTKTMQTMKQLIVY